MDSSPPPSPPSSQQSYALHVGCEFDTVESLKQLCHNLAIEDGFEFKPRSSKTAYTTICKGEGCAWRLYASSIDSSRRFPIKTFNSKHSCFGFNHGGNKQAIAALIASKIAGKLKDQPNYCPSDIVIDMKFELGIEISYSKALCTRDAALVLNNGTHEDAYKNLPRYCQDLEAADPKTKALIERTVENKFQRLFLCYSACAVRFAYCHPLLGLDGTHLKSKYKGILLAATLLMPMDNCFPSRMRLSALKMMTTGYGSFVFFVKSLKPMLPCFSLLEIKMTVLYFFPIAKKVYLKV